MKPLLVGQAPGPNTDPALPLYPLPRTSAGGRLAQYMGLSRTQYLRSFDRVNLLQFFPGQHKRDDKFPLKDARIAASAMTPFFKDREILLVGRNVATAFGYVSIPFFHWIDGGNHSICIVPHTSGRNHWYNSESNREECRAFWAEYLSTRGLPVLLERGKLAQLVSDQLAEKETT